LEQGSGRDAWPFSISLSLSLSLSLKNELITKDDHPIREVGSQRITLLPENIMLQCSPVMLEFRQARRFFTKEQKYSRAL
jgi:hypothetical protein